MGASIAFHLARRRAGRILVLDKGDVAGGGSGRSSALVRMHYSFPPRSTLRSRASGSSGLGRTTWAGGGDFRQTGFVRIVPEKELDKLEKNVAMQREHGVDARVVTRRELSEIVPDWNVDDVPAAAWEPGSGYGDGAGVANDLPRARAGDGRRLPLRTRVDRVSGGRRAREGRLDRSRGLRRRRRGRGDGAVEPCALRGGGLRSPGRGRVPPGRHPQEPAGPPGTGARVHRRDHDDVLPLRGRRPDPGRRLLGPARRGPDDFPQSASTESLTSLVERVAARVPALAEAGIWRGVTGVYDVSPDFRPLIGEVPGVAGLYVAAGFSGMGFKISPAVGLVVSELLLDGRASSVDIRDFAPDRFARGRHIKADCEYGDEEPTAYT